MGRSGGRSGGSRSSGSRSSSSRSSGSRSSSSRSSSSSSRGSSSRGSSSFGGGGGSFLGRSRSHSYGAGFGVLINKFYTFLFIIFVISLLQSHYSISKETQVTLSTHKREPLPAGSVIEGAYYIDGLDWIDSETNLLKGMRHFYKKTGVQPVLVLTDRIQGEAYPSGDDADEYAQLLYEKNFKDEAHFILVFQEYGDAWTMGYTVGKQAQSVIDREAADILMDYIERYYYQEDLSEDEVFSLAFSKAADRIMSVTTPPIVKIIIALSVVAVVGIASVWWRKRMKAKKEESELTKKILETPLETFGTSFDIDNKD